MQNFGHKAKETYSEELVISYHHEPVTYVALEMHTCCVKPMEIFDTTVVRVREICDAQVSGICDVLQEKVTCDVAKERVTCDAAQVRVICDVGQVRVICDVG